MKIVIDISEELYAKVPYLINKGSVLIGDVLDAVEKGTPLEAQPTDKCKGCYYNDGETHAECVVCDKEAQPTDMRDATEEESQSVKNYIKSISKPTGLNFDEAYEEFEELDFIAPHKRLSVNLMVQPTDAVSREEALLALTGMDLPTDRDKLIALFTNRIQHLPPVQSQPCEDAVSRSEAITELTALIENFKGIQGDMGSAINSARELIKTLPIVMPQRKKGKWIEVNRGIHVTDYRCSECGRIVRDDTGYDVSADYPYCHCGAEMSGGDEDA